jgi:hypothetical protein|tara:strand:+ start:11694 stop:12314 length:621 start_codon:yes stop_codon:yes gene_type:complete
VKNILIIATPRSGSTNLLNAISSAYNYDWVFEPTPSILNTRRWEIANNQVVKVIAYPYDGKQLKGNDTHYLKSSPNYPTFYKDIISQYDQTILLSRRNLKEQVESLSVLLNGGRLDRVHLQLPTAKWISSDLDKIPIEEINRIEQNMIVMRNTIEELSKEFNIPIDYYEDVYSNKTLLNKNIKLDLDFLEKTKKCRTASLENKYLL